MKSTYPDKKQRLKCPLSGKSVFVTVVFMLGMILIAAWSMFGLGVTYSEVGRHSRAQRTAPVKKHTTTTPCSTGRPDKNWPTDTSYLCYTPGTLNYLVSVPRNQGQRRMDAWANYVWYMKYYLPLHTGWGPVFATTDRSWDKSAYGMWSEAKKWSALIHNFTVSEQKVTFVLKGDTKDIPEVGDIGGTVWSHTPPCSYLLICAWYWSTDPCWSLTLCKEPIAPSVAPINNAVSAIRVIGGREGVETIVLPREGLTPDRWFQVFTGISGQTNNWLLMAEQAANTTSESCVVCMGPRPLLKITPAPFNTLCLKYVVTSTYVAPNCSKWDQVYPLVKAARAKPLFSSKVARDNLTCVNMTHGKNPLSTLSPENCTTVVTIDEAFYPESRGDVWWWCGGKRILDRMPKNVSGLCAIVCLLLPVRMYEVNVHDLADSLLFPGLQQLMRTKRDKTWQRDKDPTYIDAIGVPRGVPDEYKLADQVAGGFESLFCWWCTINKNVDRINYIHYNVQRLGNWTQSGFEAVHGQLAATSLMAFQNRIALDMLLAEKHGVCSLFGQECCTFVPNNTAPDGGLTLALEGFRTLNGKMKEHSGVDTTLWDSWMSTFGKYRALVSSVLVSIAVFAAVLTLCGCCCIPCIRALVQRLISTAITPSPLDNPQAHPLLEYSHSDSDQKYDTDSGDETGIYLTHVHGI